MAAPHGDVGLAGFVDVLDELAGGILRHGTTADGSNLAATIQAVADNTVPEGEVGHVHITVGCIAATESVTGFKHDVITHGILVNLFHKVVFLTSKVITTFQRFIVDMTILDNKFIVVVFRCRDIIRQLALVTDETIEHVEVGCATHYTTFTASIGITVDGRNTVEVEEFIFINGGVASESCGIGCCNVFFGATYDDVSLAKDIVGNVSGAVCRIVLANGTFPSAAIDITCLTALDISSRGGDE